MADEKILTLKQAADYLTELGDARDFDHRAKSISQAAKRGSLEAPKLSERKRQYTKPKIKAWYETKGSGPRAAATPSRSIETQFLWHGPPERAELLQTTLLAQEAPQDRKRIAALLRQVAALLEE